jgi:hypothetical protein
VHIFAAFVRSSYITGGGALPFPLVQYRNVAGSAAGNRRDSRERPTPGSHRRDPQWLNRSPGPGR